MGVVNNKISIDNFFKFFDTRKMSFEVLGKGTLSFTEPTSGNKYQNFEVYHFDKIKRSKHLLFVTLSKVTEARFDGKSTAKNVFSGISTVIPAADSYITGQYMLTLTEIDPKDYIDAPSYRYVKTIFTFAPINSGVYNSLKNSIMNDPVETNVLGLITRLMENSTSTVNQRNLYTDVTKTSNNKNNVTIYAEQPTEFVYALYSLN